MERLASWFLMCLICASAAILGGCGAGTTTTIVISSGGIEVIDQGQTLTLTATISNNGNGQVAWVITSGPGTLSGANSTSATYNAPASVTGATSVTVTVTSTPSSGPPTTQSFMFTVTPPPSLGAGGNLAAGTEGIAYNQSPSVTGGAGTLTWAVQATPNPLPAGLSINSSTGAITGTPTGPSGSSTFTVKVMDSGSPQISASAQFTILINNYPAPTIAPASSSLPTGVVGTAYAQQTFTASAGHGPYAFSIVNGSLPAGLNQSSSGSVLTVSGTPSGPPCNPCTFSVKVVDSSNPTQTVTNNYGIVITPAPPVITTTPAQVPSATINVAYTFQLHGSGYGTLIWGTSPALSDGLSLNTSTGVISGTPTTATTLNFSVTLTDGVGQQTTETGFSMVVSTERILFTSSVPSGLTEGVSAGITATVFFDAGNGGVDWSVTCASSPCGSFTASHTASGTETIFEAPPSVPTGGTVTVTATAHDAPNPQVSAVVTVTYPRLMITTTSLPNGTVNSNYSATINASGGLQPYIFSLDASSAQLPAGLSINSSTGAITGAPTAPSPNVIIVDVQDSETPPMTTQATYSFIINYATATASCGTGSESKLGGQYAFMLQGFDANGAVALIGSFTADGTGKITGGEEDLSNSTTGNTPAPLSLVAASSSYSVGLDTNGGYRGCITLATSAATSTYRFVLSRFGEVISGVAGNGQMTEFDTTGTLASGVMHQQIGSAFTNSQVSGNYAFGASATESLTGERFGIAGVFSVSGTTISSGTADTNIDGNVNQNCSNPCTFTGTRASPDGNGRTTFSITPTGGSPVDMVYYTVSASELLLMSNDAQGNNGVFGGTILQQSGSFSNASLSGNTVISLTGVSEMAPAPPRANVQIGLLSFPSPGNFTFSADENNSVVMSTSSASGMYSVASNGRVTTSGGSSAVYYLVSANEGFVVGTDTSVATGFFEPQSAFENNPGYVSGVFGFGTVGPAEQDVDYREGWVNFYFQGSEIITETSDDVLLLNGQKVGQISSQYYAVAQNGRGTVYACQGGSCSNLMPQVIFYIVSPTKVILMEAYDSFPEVAMPTVLEGQQ